MRFYGVYGVYGVCAFECRDFYISQGYKRVREGVLGRWGGKRYLKVNVLAILLFTMLS